VQTANTPNKHSNDGNHYHARFRGDRGSAYASPRSRYFSSVAGTSIAKWMTSLRPRTPSLPHRLIFVTAQTTAPVLHSQSLHSH
jgi:hypothetical protein